MVALVEEVGVDAVRAKSVDLTTYAIGLLRRLAAAARRDHRVAPRRGPARRPRHRRPPEHAGVTAALSDQDVLPDYRDPGRLRIGLSPLSTSFNEARRGIEAGAGHPDRRSRA